MAFYQQRHLTNSVIMVRPHDFGFNEQTSSDNVFQHHPEPSINSAMVTESALAEFAHMVSLLRKAGVEVLVLDKPSTDSILPDAIFPNNWFSTTEDGRLFIYPMKTANRQAEVQLDELHNLCSLNGYKINDLIDIRKMTLSNGDLFQALEGTGSLVFHHQTSSLFANLSERCNKAELDTYSEQFGYHCFDFTSSTVSGLNIYHTNVLMSCGEGFAVIASQTLTSNHKSKVALNQLKDTVEDLIIISEQQMTEYFCGNIIQLQDENQDPLIVLSESAYQGFSSSQLKTLTKHGSLVICPIPTIEHIGGGSARCMIAENFLPK